MMRHAILLPLLAGVVLIANLGIGAEQPHVHGATGVTLPDAIAGLPRGEVKGYGPSPTETGVAVPYSGDGVEATIFIRRVDGKEAPTAATLVKDTLATVLELEKAGVYSNVKLLESAEGSDAPGWAKGGYTATADGNVLLSLTYITIRNEHVVKLRVTTIDLKSKQLFAFVEEFQKLVNAAQPK